MTILLNQHRKDVEVNPERILKHLFYFFNDKTLKCKSAKSALTQAERRKHRERFSKSDKDTLLIGVNFNSKSRNISDWKGVFILF